MKKRIALLSLAVVLVGCATMINGSFAPVSIMSYPSGAYVEIKKSDGIVVAQGRTPMTANLGRGKDYLVTISLDDLRRTVPIVKGDIDFTKAVCANVLCNGLIPGLLVDYFSGAIYKLEPNTIHVSLQEVSSQDGSGSAIYAFLTIVGEDGTQQYATIEMTPASAN